MPAPKLYRWDDTDAPVLSGTEGSLINLLDKCLVTGYSTGATAKAAAGWSKPFAQADGLVAAFRNDAVNGTGMYFRVDDRTARGTYAPRWGWVQPYETMSDVNTGAAAWGAGAVYKSDTASTAARAWVLIADSRCFYLHVFTTTNAPGDTGTDAATVFFGDFVSFVPGDAYAAAAITGADNAWGNLGRLEGFAYDTGATPYHISARNSNGATAGQGFKHVSGSCYRPNASQVYAGSSESPFAHPFNGQTLYARPLVSDGSAANALRGYLPGCYYPLHFQPLANFAHLNDAGLDLYALRGRNAYNNISQQLLIDLSANFRPE